MHSVADLLAHGLKLPPLDAPPAPVPEGTCCVLSGLPIAQGYPVMEVISEATGEFLDAYRGFPTGCVAEAAARVIRQDWNLGSRVVFADGAHYRPRIAPETEKTAPQAPKTGKGAFLHRRDGDAPRPLWRDLVRDVWPARAGENVLFLLTTDTKKRLWPRARVGPLGSATPLYFHDAETCTSAVLTLDWPRLLEILALVETIYRAGFSKRSLRDGLGAQWSAVYTVGIPQMLEWERGLTDARRAPEFRVAVLIAQKTDPKEDPAP